MDTQNYPSDGQGNWHFAEVSGTHHTQRHSAKVPEETILAWSGIQHSITEQAINQRRNRLNALVKAKGKHFEHLL